MILIHYTKRFTDGLSEESKKEAILNKVQGLLKIENPENLNSVDKFPKGMLVVKLFKSNLCRIVVQPKMVSIDGNEKHVFFIREYVSSSSFDYVWGNVTFPMLKSGEWINSNPLPNTEIEAFKKKYASQELNNEHIRPLLPDDLIKWTSEFKMTLKFDIYERENWVSFANNRTVSGLQDKYILLFKKMIKGILNDDSDLNLTKTSLSKNPLTFSLVNTDDDIGIIYGDYPDIQGKRVIVLHDGANTFKQKERWENALANAKNESLLIEADLTAISKDAFRAYPKWIIDSESDDLWESIQRYEGTYNFSLLPEQVSFLKDFKFPTYINGQAGSGKSTMLYYLFANIFLYKCFNDLNGDIIFLTENDKLLEHTTQSVIGLLSSNPEFNTGLSIEQRGEVRRHFLSFRKFLLEILPDEAKPDFPENKYLDFAKFKDEYNKRHTKSKHSAEEVWFILSTYVFGYFENRVIDSVEKYTNDTTGIPFKFRIVSPQNFGEIIKESLHFYTKLIESGWWDKTTLVRRIRKYYPEELPRQYSVVFCDEAQDFSRIELRLIIQSSIYTSYDLSKVSQIPIVFAGDALQTVSPTGFSDRRLHQMYYDAFMEVNFEYDKKRSTYNPTYNYRSVRSIVRLANLIQNYRKESLQEDVFIKQEAKRAENIIQAPILHDKEWILLDNNRKVFTEKFKYKSFIVPVDLHEENRYVVEEPLLKDFTDVKSSIDSKGAEYSEVVVYGFGDKFLEEFGELNWEKVDYDFKIKFFFNKLYVALTRAQNELILIDSKKAIDGFWTRLLEIPQSIKDRWENYIEPSELLLISPETGLDSIRDSSPDDAIQNAIKDMHQGILDKNVARLIVASNVFVILGKEKEANLCLGYKEEIKEEWIKAADHFEKALEYDLAARALFIAKSWDGVKAISNRRKGKDKEAHLLIVGLMVDGNWERGDLKRVYDLGNSLFDVMRDVPWYQEYSERLVDFAKRLNSSEMKRELTFILENVIRDNDMELRLMLGTLYFETRQYSQSIEAWDFLIYGEANLDLFPDYLRAKIEKAKDEGNLVDEILWSGHLILNEINEEERNSISRKIINSFTEHQGFQPEASETQLADLNKHFYAASALMGNITNLGDFGRRVESQITKKGNLLTFYTTLIKKCQHEGASIFLKERWAKIQFKILQESGLVEEKDLLTKLNKEFSLLNFPFVDSNQPWSSEELNEISDFPESVSKKPDASFKNFSIENFKRFEKLELKNLGQFNLVLGDNNSGKTTVLEALLFDPDPDNCLINYLYSNKQRNHNATKEHSESYLSNIISKKVDSKRISCTIKNGRRLWTYSLRYPTTKELFDKTAVAELNSEHYLAISTNDSVELSDSIEILEDKLNDPKVLSEIPFIPFGKGYSEKLSSVYFSQIGYKKNLRESFVTQMKLFIPSIQAITIDPNSDTINIEEKVNGIDFESPLHHYGEGANKLFRILVQLHAAKNGRLMIDEIDAGIHYSRFGKFWEMIILAAAEYNVQIFATTHNEECIEHFWNTLQKDKLKHIRSRSRVITLESKVNSNEPVPIIRDFDSMKYAYEHHLEIRGRG